MVLIHKWHDYVENLMELTKNVLWLISEFTYLYIIIIARFQNTSSKYKSQMYFYMQTKVL
jgi:hypothetical protein